MTEFHRIAGALRSWPQVDVRSESYHDPEIRRLARILNASRHGGIRPGDFCGLLRTVMRRAACQLEAPAPLVIPESKPFPARDVLRAYGILAQVHGPGLLRLDVEPWRPSWSDGAVVDEWVYGHLPDSGGATEMVPADPAVRRLTGYHDFVTPGQAGATRAAMLLDGHLPLLVNLPTGAGKSLAFQTMALVEAERGRSTVVVVPTTALALDQERRFLATGRLVGPLAYHSGLTKEARAEFHRELRNGTKRVAIASPEAALGALLPSLSHLAKEGSLAALVIDEAHLVSGWGGDFRPEFQLLGGLQRHLRAIHPEGSRFRTLLLTATVTRATRRDLEAVFGSFREVAAVGLRQEPEYWLAHFSTHTERSRAVLDAIRHLPRPCIVYTSKREDAAHFFELIRDECGMSRIALVRGGDLSSDRGSSTVITDWEEGRLDAVVATSAFGLGVDNREARAVIHACVPESLDRFYQELGRAGRDGRPSISLLLWCDADLDVARSLGRERYIGDEKGWGRWRAMFANRVSHPSDPELVGLPIDHVPHWLEQQSHENSAWNLRTLNLMQRAAVLSLEAEPWPTQVEDEGLGSLPLVWARIRSPEAANRESNWRSQVRPIRDDLVEEDLRELERLRGNLLSCETPFGELFAQQYEFGSTSIACETGPDPVTRAQAPCSPVLPLSPCPTLVDAQPIFPTPIPGFLPGTIVEIPEAWGIDDSVRLMLELIARGFADVAVPRKMLEHPLLRESDRRSPCGYVVLRDTQSRCGTERRTAQMDFQIAGRIVYVPTSFPARRLRALTSRLRLLEMASFVFVEPGLRESEPPFRPLLSVLEGPRVRAETLLHRLRHGNPKPNE